MDDRTEAPTPKRRREAREKGQVAKSVEINSAAVILAAFWLFSISGGRFYQGLSALMRQSFSQFPDSDLTAETIFSITGSIMMMIVWILAPFTLILLLVGLVANFAQVGPLFSSKVLQPDLNKLNPVNGLKKLFSLRSVADLIKSIIKVLVVGAVIYITLRDNFTMVLSTSRMSLTAGVSALVQLGIEVGFRVGMIMVVIAALDFVYQRYEHEKSLKMSKQEVKEEMKQYENPFVKSRIRARQRQLAMSRMMAAIPQADVVITNPTHLAIALKYDQGKMQAPQVVAKGERLVAERIKSKAKECNVPVMENKPLARTLFKAVQVGQFIPAELFQAVAEVLAFVYRLKTDRSYSWKPENRHETAQMQKVLASVDDLKPLPATVNRALQLLDEPDVTINQIVSVLSMDQAITARLLKLANSAYYGRPAAASTLHEAVMRLGFKRTKNLLFALSYSSLLSRRVAGYNLGHGELWQHSVAVAMTAPRIAERVAYHAPDEAYIAGLLHDIGKLMLDQYFTINWDQLLESSRQHKLSIIETEERLLGMNHAQVGGELARKWDLPVCLVEAIAFHHEPSQAKESVKLAAIVNLANHICNQLGFGWQDPAVADNWPEATLDILSLTPVDMLNMQTYYREMLTHALVNNPELVAAG